MTHIKEFWILLKVDFINTYSLNRLGRFNKASRIPAIVRALLLLAMFAYLYGSLLYYSYYSAWLIFASQGGEFLKPMVYQSILSISMITFVGCIYKAFGYLFSSSDLDLLFSLPVRPGSIFASKLIILYGSCLLLSFIAGSPGLIVYGLFVDSPVTYYCFAIVLFLLTPVIPALIGSLVSVIISRITSKTKHKALFSNLFSLLLLLFITLFSFFSVSPKSMELIRDTGSLYEMFNLYLPGRLIFYVLTSLNLGAFCLTVFIHIFLFSVFTATLASNYKRINSLLKENYASSDYEMRPLSASPQIFALVKKEVNTYFSSPVYVMNTLYGILLLAAYAIALLFMDFETLAGYLEFSVSKAMILPATTLYTVFAITSCCTTGISFSMEGKAIDILRSLPIKFKTIVLAKVLLNLLITVPALFVCSAVISFALKFSFAEYLLLLLPSLLFCILSALNGIVVNLFFPKLNFKSPTEVVKRSASALLTLLSNFAFIVISCFAYLFCEMRVMPYTSFIGVICLILCVLCLLYRLFINTVGIKLYEKLSDTI